LQKIAPSVTVVASMGLRVSAVLAASVLVASQHEVPSVMRVSSYTVHPTRRMNQSAVIVFSNRLDYSAALTATRQLAVLSGFRYSRSPAESLSHIETTALGQTHRRLPSYRYRATMSKSESVKLTLSERVSVSRYLSQSVALAASQLVSTGLLVKSLQSVLSVGYPESATGMKFH
jgi:hypothetical protein